jgi:catechol 2,3-dioxygenase-like lactoylglutathione lyase family enzyme
MNLGRFETSLDVKDIERALAFYKALGFRQTDGGVDVRTIGLRRGDCRLTLFQGHLDPPQTQLIFWQGNVRAIAYDLVRKGLSFDEGHPRYDDRGNAAGMMRDPDGHPIFFINMPVNYVDEPAHAKKSPPYRPRMLKPDKRLGWFELSLVVQDVVRSRAFYEKLGFRLCDTGDEGRSVTLQNNDCRIALFQDGLYPAETQLTFWQGDIEAIGRDLTAKGLAFERGPARGADGGVGALTRDPDGHAICFVNRPGETRKEPWLAL